MALILKDSEILIVGGSLAVHTDCCCESEIGIIINICNANKWSDTPRNAKINGNVLSTPTNHVNGNCGGGYYSNAPGPPSYCGWGTNGSGVGLICCGDQVGGTSSTCTGCDSASYSGHTYTAGVYPATGCKGEDCGCSNAGGYSNFQTDCTLGDCSGDLTTQSFSSAWLNIGGSNTFESEMTAAGRCSGDYGVVQVFKINYTGGTWVLDSGAALVNTFYGTGTFSASFSL